MSTLNSISSPATQAPAVLAPMPAPSPAERAGAGPSLGQDRFVSSQPGVAELERFRLSLGQAEGFAKAARRDPSYRASAAAAFQEAAAQSLTWEAAQRVAQSARSLGYPEEAKAAQARAVALGGPQGAPRKDPEAGKVLAGAGAAVVGGALMGILLGGAVLRQQR